MGDPNTGEIYEGALRKATDVELTAEQANALKQQSMEERIRPLGRMSGERAAVPSTSISPGPPQQEFNPQPDLRTLEGAKSFLDYHKPDDEQLRAHHEVNLRFQELLQHIWLEIPPGPGKTVLIRDLNRARMSANSAITHYGA